MALSLEDLARLIESQSQELHELRAKLARLEAANMALPNPPATSARLGRRRLLRKLGLGLLAGTTAITANLWQSGNEAAAKVEVTLPTVGAVVSPHNSTFANNLPNGVTIGLLASSLSSLDLNTFTPGNLGVYGAGASFGLYGKSDAGTGVYGSSNSAIGVFGFSTGSIGVYGVGQDHSGVFGNSTTGAGVHGYSNSGYGVQGESLNSAGVYSNSTSGTGVYSVSSTGTGVYGKGSIGVYGDSTVLGSVHLANASITNSLPGNITIGLIADASSNLKLSDFTDNQNIGLYAIAGTAPNITSYAGIFSGDVLVTGHVSKAALTFKIDHPLDPENKYLYHSGVESPDSMNIYNGNLKLDEHGEATVILPEWFEALNRDFRYQLTALGAASPNLHIAAQVSGNRFKIAGGEAGQEISWQVTGVRQDRYALAHPVPVEQAKNQHEKGKYLHPEAWGVGPERGVMPTGTPLSETKK